ncbi:MAG: hypothetical protein HFH59_12260 [Lachnospiraceae bacterium]|nr:hypothetical protein [Lachnospiraceae bacterium]
MIALKITNLKKFMSQLLIGECFDSFWLSEASITTGNTYIIEGTLHPEFFSEEAQEVLERCHRTHSLWKEMKPFCYSIIRGKQTPLQFKFVFRLSYEKVRHAVDKSGISLEPDHINGLFLNIQYSAGQLSCTTGTSMSAFSLDKSLDQMWDRMVLHFFQENDIDYEESF